MRVKNLFIVVLCLGLMGCAAKKGAVSHQPSEVSQEKAWHTCLMQGVQIGVSTDDEKLSSGATMQVVRDSMLIISVMPMLNIEMLRLEATPDELIIIDKLNNRYARTDYTTVNRKIVPQISWHVLQQLCSAELPTGPEQAHMRFTYAGEKTIDLIVNYPTRQVDVPVRVTHQRLDKYKEVNVSKFL